MIHHITLRTSAQATEDPEKVRTALSLFLPELEEVAGSAVSDVISETNTSGYYDNPITLFEAHIEKRRDCRQLTDRIKENLDQAGMSRLMDELPLRVDDDCNLYIRFDKQEAYQGRFVTTRSSDAVLMKIKLKVYPARREKALKVAETLFGREE